MIRSGGKSTKHPLQCCSVRRVLSRCLITEKHMGRHRCTPEERDLSEGFAVKYPGCRLILGQTESKVEEENFFWEGGAWVGHTGEMQEVEHQHYHREFAQRSPRQQITRMGHFDLKRQLISQVKKPNNAGKLM